MTDPEFELLEPFRIKPGVKWFRTAYKWNRDEIYRWMKTTAEAGGVPPGGVPPDGWPPDGEYVARKILMAIYVYITNLSLLEGTLYKKYEKPFSHIARLPNDKFGQEDEPSRFIVSGWNIGQSIYSFMGPAPGWWCPYDLLGLFLSLLGPAPDAANKNNFYLPLTAVYARWCSRIAGHPDKNWKWKPSVPGVGAFPFVFQCTWHTTVDEKTKQHWGQYFLGASTAGMDISEGPLREKVQEARFNMLFTCQKVTMVQENDFKEKKAPNMNASRRTMVPFGNCGETYPFATRFLRDKAQNNSMAGLALMKKFMTKKEYPEYEYDDSEILKNLMAPCDNCAFLIRQAGGNESNFALELGKESGVRSLEAERAEKSLEASYRLGT